MNPSAPIEDDQLPPRAWLVRNGAYLVLFAALFIFLYRSFGTDGMWNIAKAGLGLGFVIFIHELGHFAVAKWCDVHVQAFSIGFGPALPGCSFKYGETTYKLALFPLGGYVKMVGEGDTDASSEDDPRSFKNKSVGQRMAIISAGVIMNVLLAIVCFIFVFNHGKEREPAVVAAVDTGGPAYQAGVPTGADLIQIGSKEARPNRPLYFAHLKTNVALSGHGDRLTVRWVVPPSNKEYRAEIEPRRGDGDLQPMIGLAMPDSTQLRTGDLPFREGPYPFDPHSPAAAARVASAFRPGDVIIALTDPDDPGAVELVPEVMVGGRSDAQALFELSRRWLRLADQPLTAWVRRDGQIEEIAVPAAHFMLGDTIIAATDPDNPGTLATIPDDPRYPGTGKGNIFVLRRRMERLAGQLFTVRVRRLTGQEEELLLPPAYNLTLGARMQMGTVGNIRDGSSAAKAGVQRGDILVQVTLTAKGGQSRDFFIAPPRKGPGEDEPAVKAQELVDPLRLPYELQQWAEAHREEEVKARLTVLRYDPQTHEDRKREALPEVEWDFSWRFDRERPFNRNSPWPIPELGFAYRIETTVAAVTGPPAAETGGLQADDVIKAIRFRNPGDKWGESKEGSWIEKIKPEQWAYLSYILQGLSFPEVTLRVDRGGTMHEVQLTARPDETWPSDDLGLHLQPEKVIQKADGIVEAVQMGLEDTYRGVTEVYLFLRGIIIGRLSLENLGGPITIGRVAYRFAQMDFYEFLFFLGMISINLAAFNFLPIPVLDGGHMVFLLYEKLRGKPASEQVQWGATLVGLALLGTLMIGVLILDVMKLI